jgi:glycosyltransferase involved in cell wall biosynthesis
MNRVTVFLPVYNAEQFLEECIVSILYQSYEDFELLVVDDGSTDKSVEIIHSFNDERIRFIQNNHNYIETINMAFSESKGEYIARMDSDDKMMLNRLEKQVQYMDQNPELFVCTGLAQCFGESEHIYGSCFNNVEDLWFEMLNGNPIVHPTAMFRKDLILKYKLTYNEQYIYGEDFRLWFEISTLQSKKRRIAVIPEILINYRVSDTQISMVKTLQQYHLAYFILKDLLDFIFRKYKIKKTFPNELNDKILLEIISQIKQKIKNEGHKAKLLKILNAYYYFGFQKSISNYFHFMQ